MKRPFVYIFFSLFLGIIISHLLGFYIRNSLAILLVIVFIAMLLVSNKYERLLVVIIFCIIGSQLYNYSLRSESILNSAIKNKPLRILVLNDGLEKGRYTPYTEYEVSILLTKEKSLVRVHNQNDINFNVGDVIELNNYKLKAWSENTELDSYSFYLKSKNISYIIDISYSDISHIETKSIRLRSISSKIRMYVEGYIDRSFDYNEGNLLKSIVFGNRGYMTADSIEHFSKSGTAHIIAVSGLHIGLVIIFLEQALKLLGVRKKIIKILTVLILLVYAAAVNFPISIVRAMIMYYLYIAAFFLERKYDAINSMMLIATILVIMNPFIIFSVSFQLSFTATLGILLLYPLIFSKIESVLPKVISSLLSVTIAAQIATLPILVYHFNYISLVSIVPNLIIVPVMGLLISLSLGSIILGLIPIGLEKLINLIIDILLKYISITAKIFSSNSFFGITIEFVELYHVIIYYVIVAVIYMVLSNAKIIKLVPLEE